MGFQTNDTLFRTNANGFRTNANGFRTNANGMAMTLFRTNESSTSDQCNGFSDQWAVGPLSMATDHRHGTTITMSITPAEARKACRKQTRCYRKQAKYLYYRPPYMHRAHFTPCLHGVYIVHTLPAHFTAVKMSSAFPRPTISAANGCAIIAAFPLKRLHHRMRPVDADLVYTSTGQVALTILLENGGLMLIAELTRLLLQWLW